MQTAHRGEALAGRSHWHEVPVRWGDLDALRHVNNTVYFRFMEEARVAGLHECGIGADGEHRSIVLAHVSCDFLRPVLWPAVVVVETRIERIGNTSIESTVELSVKGDPEGPCARGRTVIVGVDSRTGRSSPWTSSELEGIARIFVGGTS